MARKRRRRSPRKSNKVLFLVLLAVLALGAYKRVQNNPNTTRTIVAMEDGAVQQIIGGADDKTNLFVGLSAFQDKLIVGIVVLCCVIIIASIALIIYSAAYFRGRRFKNMKREISLYIKDCNDLNEHIEELRGSFATTRKTDFGEATYENISHHNYKKTEIQEAKYAPDIYDCSRIVCDNARKQPFKYVCKYFNIPIDEQSYHEFESILNNFMAAEEGKELLQNRKDEILNSIKHEIPFVIRKLFGKKLERELGFEEYNFNEMYFPTFSFRYISAGGNSGVKYDVVFDIPMLQRFVAYLGDTVKFRKSVEGQRRLMTPKLRQFIIERDYHTCQRCGNSTNKEPNLLLEVDHIVPVSKGGITTEDNLQTLCWKCNRHKGAKILFEY